MFKRACQAARVLLMGPAPLQCPAPAAMPCSLLVGHLPLCSLPALQREMPQHEVLGIYCRFS